MIRHLKKKHIIMSDEKVSVNTWGPPMWRSIHTLTLTYPNYPTRDHMQTALNYFINLGRIIPCIVCRNHYQTFLKKYPIQDACTSKTKLFKYFVDMHNFVNRLNKKKVYTYDEALAIYV